MYRSKCKFVLPLRTFLWVQISNKHKADVLYEPPENHFTVWKNFIATGGLNSPLYKFYTFSSLRYVHLKIIWSCVLFDCASICLSVCQCRTVHTDSTLWTILSFKMQKWFPSIFEFLYLHLTSDLIELYVYK